MRPREKDWKTRGRKPDLIVRYPHIWVRWNEDRQIKTAVSQRAVPLVGDALIAANEALERAGSNDALFDRYSGGAGADSVSQSLMNYVRLHTNNPLHVVYSLRHNMKDWLVMAGVSERDEHRILGHAQGGVGNRVYGGDEAKLIAAMRAMERAIAVAEVTISESTIDHKP